VGKHAPHDQAKVPLGQPTANGRSGSD
jgi:hypothetical protein